MGHSRARRLSSYPLALIAVALIASLLGGCSSRRSRAAATAGDGTAQSGSVGNVVAKGDIGQLVSVKNVRATDEKVTGTLVNRTPRTLRDVQLMIQHTFLWNNERNPGTNNPGRTEYFLVLEDIPPDGKVAFEYRPDPPLPKRGDGRFETKVEVIAFTEVGS